MAVEENGKEIYETITRLHPHRCHCSRHNLAWESEINYIIILPTPCPLPPSLQSPSKTTQIVKRWIDWRILAMHWPMAVAFRILGL